MPPDGPGHYFTARIRGGDVAAVSSIPEGAPPTATWNTYVWVDSADDTAAKVRDAGGTVLAEPFDVMDAGRMGVFADPEGAVFCVWQPNQHRGARVVNEHGALNFNGLNTRDVPRAKAFYAAVFGWGTLDANMREDTMWTMPGYGDHLEEATPGLREFIASVGGPAGFEDVVASINPIPDDQPDTPPHWSVTFGVDDVDAIASKAAELGGHRGRATDGRTVVAGGGGRRPGGRDVHRQQVRPREQGHQRLGAAQPIRPIVAASARPAMSVLVCTQVWVRAADRPAPTIGARRAQTDGRAASSRRPSRSSIKARSDLVAKSEQGEEVGAGSVIASHDSLRRSYQQLRSCARRCVRGSAGGAHVRGVPRMVGRHHRSLARPDLEVPALI